MFFELYVYVCEQVEFEFLWIQQCDVVGDYVDVFELLDLLQVWVW